MKSTPFDDIAVRLSEASMALRGESDEKLLHCITFIQVCRVKYLQMVSTSEKAWNMQEEMMKQPNGTRSISTKEMIDHSLQTMEAKINYFSFIEELNRFGRVFEEKYGVTLPEYFKIRFYRNKMIEHGDQYEEYLNTMGSGYMFQKGKLIIPSHFGAINMPPRSEEVYKGMSDEFKELGVDLPPLGLEMTVDSSYSDAIFSNLAKINPRLEGVPKSLVNTLFQYSFPVPINSLETYITQLVGWLEDFTREYKVS